MKIEAKSVLSKLKLEKLAPAIEKTLTRPAVSKGAKDEMSTGAGRALRLQNLTTEGLDFIKKPFPFPTNLRDLITATKLKGAITDVLSTVRLGKPLAEKDEPKPGPNGRYTAPNGDPLIRVKLQGSSGVAGSSEYALVNPKTNEFYKEDNHGGFMHPTSYYGPMSLPKGTRFVGKKFTEAQLQQLEKAANKGFPGPIRRDLGAVLEAHLKAGDLDFSNKAPKKEDILSEKVVKHEHPFTYTAIILKDDPDHVIYKKVLTGGFVPAGPNDGSYSQPVAIDQPGIR